MNDKKMDVDLGNYLQGPYQQDIQKLDQQSTCSPQVMTFCPWYEGTIDYLEKVSCRIRQHQQADPSVCGYPVVENYEILYHYHWLVQKLLDVSGLTPEEQEKYVIKHLKILINWIHLIPASGKHHHRTMGGLFEHSVECAIFAVNEIKASNIFKQTSVKSDKIPASRWVVAAILCALFHDLGKVMVDTQIYSKDQSESYNPETPISLLIWAYTRISSQGSYFVSWRPNPKKHEEILALMLKSKNILDNDVYRWLGRAVGGEVRKFFNNYKSVFRYQIIKADRKSIEYSMRKGQYLRTPNGFFDCDRVNFFEAVKRLIFYGTQYQENGEAKWFVERGVRLKGWTVDTPNSALLSSEDGLYIVFDQLRQIRNAFELDNVQTHLFNRSKTTAEISDDELNSELGRLVNHLKKAGCLSSCGDSPYWHVRRVNPYTRQEYGKPLKAIRLNSLATWVIFNYREQMIPDSRFRFAEYKGERNSDGSIKGFTTD